MVDKEARVRALLLEPEVRQRQRVRSHTSMCGYRNLTVVQTRHMSLASFTPTDNVKLELPVSSRTTSMPRLRMRLASISQRYHYSRTSSSLLLTRYRAAVNSDKAALLHMSLAMVESSIDHRERKAASTDEDTTLP